MKTSSFLVLFAGLAASVVSPSFLAAAEPPVAPAPAPSVAAAADPASWDDIKQFTHEQRGEFLAGLAQLQNKLDRQIAELAARRAKMKNGTAEWDFALRSLDAARTYLKSRAAEVNDTTAELWNNKKEEIQRAWQATQEAYDKVKMTTTQG
jgi:hypothetical protein